tara:strand:- start:47 stop:724 length:678 start_codon:yes stop_codon:yes gene_type:complete
MKELEFNKSAALYNLILGGLIALTSEQQIGKVTSRSVSENIFLGKWLKKAKKQKRYSKSISTEIDNLIELYAIEGRSADLASLFYQIFSEFKMLKNMSQNFELRPKTRFDSAMGELAKDGWHISLPITHDRQSGEPYRPKNEKEIFSTKWHWDGAFNAQQALTKRVSFFVVSIPQEVVDCLYQHGFILIKGLTSIDDDGKSYYQYTIFPDNKCVGDAAIPTKYQN